MTEKEKMLAGLTYDANYDLEPRNSATTITTCALQIRKGSRL